MKLKVIKLIINDLIIFISSVFSIPVVGNA